MASQQDDKPLSGELIRADRPAKPPRRIRLGTPREVRREVGRIYAMLLNGELEPKQATAAGFLLRLSLESLRLDEIESRLKTLEQGR